MATKQLTETVQLILDQADPNKIADALQLIKLGTHLTPQKQTFAALTSAAAINITTAASAAAATPGLNTNTEPPQLTLPPILAVVALRVTAGAAAAGVRTVGDSGATASATVALLSDDGTTLTFETTVTGFVLEYIPRAAVSMTSVFNRS